MKFSGFMDSAMLVWSS